MIDLDDILEVRAVDRGALSVLADRLRSSTTQEQYVYREVELDEAWRLLDIQMVEVAGPDRQRIAALRDAVVVAHDLVGLEGRPNEAATALSEAIIAGLAG